MLTHSRRYATEIYTAPIKTKVPPKAKSRSEAEYEGRSAAQFGWGKDCLADKVEPDYLLYAELAYDRKKFKIDGVPF